MGGMVMMRMRNEAAEQIRKYLDSGEKDEECRVWSVIDLLLDILYEEQLESIPKILRGDTVLWR